MGDNQNALYKLLALPYLSLAADILNRFSVRIHSRLIEKGTSWIRLWYLLRALDRLGSGYAKIEFTEITELIGAKASTILQWLRQGKEAGGFRRWKCQRGILRVHLGGLFSVCRANGSCPGTGKQAQHAPWGITTEVGLHEILSLQSLRAVATASTAQRLQQLSRFAAWRKLPAPARKIYKLPQPDAFFPSGDGQRLSDNNARGSIRCLIHIGKRRAWVSRGFIPWGTSQQSIANERGIATRTVRRHLALLNVDRRQVVQSKAEYKLAAECLNHDGGGVEASDEVSLRSQDDSYFLNESGLGGRYTHKVGEVGFSRIQSRFFTYGAKPKVWLYRCNIYQPTVKLCTLAARRTQFNRVTNSSRRGSTTLCNSVKSSLEVLDERTPYQAEKDGHFS